MKKLAILLLLSISAFAQQINLGPNNPQVKGVLQPVNGGISGGAWVNTASYGQGAVVTYSGATYIALLLNVNVIPSSNPGTWTPIVIPGIVFTAPTGSQQVVQPAGTTLFSNSINGVFNDLGYTPTGATSPNAISRINNALTSCGSNPCTVVIPPNEVSTGSALSWSAPFATTASVIDQRYTNGFGFANGIGGPDLHSADQRYTYHGVNLPFENNMNGTGTFNMDLESYAYAGGTAGDQTSANAGALLLYSNRTAGNRPIWGTDINVQCTNLTNSCYAIEIDEVNNSSADDTTQNTSGLVIIASGIHNTATAIFIQGSPTEWTTGIIVDSYHSIGVEFNTLDTARIADIYIIPPDNGVNRELVGRNSTNTADVWTMNDQGSLTTTGNIQGAIIVGTSIVNTVTYQAGGTPGFTGTCAPTTTATVKGGIITGCS